MRRRDSCRVAIDLRLSLLSLPSVLSLLLFLIRFHCFCCAWHVLVVCLFFDCFDCRTSMQMWLGAIGLKPCSRGSYLASSVICLRLLTTDSEREAIVGDACRGVLCEHADDASVVLPSSSPRSLYFHEVRMDGQLYKLDVLRRAQL